MRAFGTQGSSEQGHTVPACGDGEWRIVNQRTGEWFWAGCGLVSCEACAGLHLRRLTRAMQRARPEQLVTITLVGDDWQTIRARVARCRYRITKATGRPLDWAWVVERNPEGTGHHVHAAKRGTWLTWEYFRDALAREGTGHGWLSPAGDGTSPERYLTKYLAKGGAGSWQQQLRLNGGRFIHTSRGFWLDDFGQPCTWRIARRGDGTWTRVRFT